MSISLKLLIYATKKDIYFTFNTKVWVSSIFQNDDHEDAASQGNTGNSHNHIYLEINKGENVIPVRSQNWTAELKIRCWS